MGAALPAALAAGQVFGNVLGSLGNTSLTQSELNQQYNLSKRTLADQEAQYADQLTQQAQLNPLRDQSLYNLSQILGTPLASFNPTNYAAPVNAGQQGVGGANLNALSNAISAYQPGAGGVTNNTQQMILNRLGYGNVGTGTYYDNGSTPPDTLTNAPTATATTGGTAIGGQGVTGGNANGASSWLTTPIAGAGTPTPVQLNKENNSVPPWAQNQMGLGTTTAPSANTVSAQGTMQPSAFAALSKPTTPSGASLPTAATTSGPSVGSGSSAPTQSAANSSAAQQAYLKQVMQGMGIASLGAS